MKVNKVFSITAEHSSDGTSFSLVELVRVDIQPEEVVYLGIDWIKI